MVWAERWSAMDDQAKLGRLLAAQDWAGAERVLKRMAGAKGAGAPVFYNLGKVLFEQGRFRPAATWLEKAARAAPGHANAWFELGRARLELGELEPARAAFAEALRLDPRDEDARRNAGRLALRLGRFAEARAAWEALAGDGEADIALYRVAAETRDPQAARLRVAILARRDIRAAAIKALVRVSKGAVPLDLGG